MSLTITWIGQGGYILDNGQGKMAIDPFCGPALEDTVRAYEPVIQPTNVDFVVSTHTHWDHFDPFTYENYVKPKSLLGPTSCVTALAKSKLGGSISGVVFNAGDELSWLGFNLRSMFADHDGDSIGVFVECEGKRLYFSGDTEFTSTLLMRNIGLDPDIAFICINGKFGNMNYSEAALYGNFLKAKTIVPAHYDLIVNNTEDPRQLLRVLPELAPDVNGFIMEIGRTYSADTIINRGE